MLDSPTFSGSANARRPRENRFMMRRRNLEALTARARQVLGVIRRGLTNEQIAQRLGISLDGAKPCLTDPLEARRAQP